MTMPDGTEVWGRTELDPLRNDAGNGDFDLPEPGGGEPPAADYPRHGDMSDPNSGCTVDGIPMPCTTISFLLNGHGGFVKSVNRGNERAAGRSKMGMDS